MLHRAMNLPKIYTNYPENNLLFPKTLYCRWTICIGRLFLFCFDFDFVQCQQYENQLNQLLKMLIPFLKWIYISISHKMCQPADSFINCVLYSHPFNWFWHLKLCIVEFVHRTLFKNFNASLIWFRDGVCVCAFFVFIVFATRLICWLKKITPKKHKMTKRINFYMLHQSWIIVIR